MECRRTGIVEPDPEAAAVRCFLCGKCEQETEEDDESLLFEFHNSRGEI